MMDAFGLAPLKQEGGSFCPFCHATNGAMHSDYCTPEYRRASVGAAKKARADRRLSRIEELMGVIASAAVVLDLGACRAVAEAIVQFEDDERNSGS